MHTEDNLMRIGDKVSELELQLEPLRKQSEKAVRYLELREELMGVEVAVWMDKLEKLSADAKKAEADFATASFVLQQAQEDLDRLYTQSEQMGADLRTKSEQVENLRITVNMLEGAHQQISGQIAVLEGAVANNEENLRRGEEDLRGQEDRSGGIAAQLEQTEKRIDQINVLLKAREIELDAMQRKLMDMTANAQGITRQFMELRTREVKLTADLAVKEADLRTMESRV
jgi:chromosome segregation protein